MWWGSVTSDAGCGGEVLQVMLDVVGKCYK